MTGARWRTATACAAAGQAFELASRRMGSRVMARILIVEDDHAIAEMVRAVLEEEGYAVEVVYSVPDAAERVRAHPVDLVLRDTMAHTPDAFLSALDPLLSITSRPPVVVISAHRLAREDVDMRGYDGLIRKPFDIEEFSREVARYLRSPWQQPPNDA